MHYANDCIEQFQFELACKFCQRALELESQNLHALNTYACILLELGDAEKAYDVRALIQSSTTCIRKNNHIVNLFIFD